MSLRTTPPTYRLSTNVIRRVIFVSILALAISAVLVSGCRKRPNGEPIDLLIKIEWGSLRNDEVPWRGQVELDAGEVLDAAPYEFEPDDLFDEPRLEFMTRDVSLLTDGLLLSIRAPASASLRVRTSNGVPVIPLRTLASTKTLLHALPGDLYMDFAVITREDWDTALSHGKDTRRWDAMPIDAYFASVEIGRANSIESRETMIERSLSFYDTDEFYRNAEDIRRGVNQQLYVTVPSVLAVGETFDVTVAAFDVNGFLVRDFRGPVSLTMDGGGLSLPTSIQMTPGEDSILTVPDGGIALEPGYVRVIASDPSGRFGSGAIPVRIEADPVERVYWGDLHTHSYLSDGDFRNVGPEDVYRFGRDVGRLDFVALSDHDYRRPIPDWKWPMHAQAAARYYDPGRFVTLLGYEWSGEDLRFSDVISHKNVYFRDATAPIYSAFDPRYNTPEKLWAALRRNPGVGRALTIPHHSVRRIDVTPSAPWYGGAGTDWRFHDPEMQPLVEIYSRWGISEYVGDDNPRPVAETIGDRSVLYALGLGYQLGIVADSDSHDGTPGVSVLPARQSINSYPVGLMAIVAPALTREDLFDALYAKRCYGTSGAQRILLDLRTGSGLRAGEAGTTDGVPSFRIDVAGTTLLDRVELVRIDLHGVIVVGTLEPTSWHVTAELTDPGFDEQGAYYLRVTQEDTEMGWIGPIFLTAAE